MQFERIYAMLLAKAERKGSSKAEVDTIIAWLSGYDMDQADKNVTYRQFYGNAPAWNSNANLNSGKICGVQVETIEEPLMKRIRQLDKLIDELAKGRPMEKILRRKA